VDVGRVNTTLAKEKIARAPENLVLAGGNIVQAQEKLDGRRSFRKQKKLRG